MNTPKLTRTRLGALALADSGAVTYWCGSMSGESKFRAANGLSPAHARSLRWLADNGLITYRYRRMEEVAVTLTAAGQSAMPDKNLPDQLRELVNWGSE